MPASPRNLLAVFAFAALAALPAAAQKNEPERIPFAGGELTITETPDYEKILAFDGEELARDYFVFFDRIAQVGGTDVAFIYVGPGGNACAPGLVMVWKPEGGDVMSATHGEDCGSPSPAISDTDVYFVPYLMPGDSSEVQAWNPEEGFRVHGRLNYAPQPDTGWATYDAATVTHPLDLFRNADLYAAAQVLLGEALGEVMAGLGTASEPEVTQEGLLSARGCVPHACSVADTFVVVDGNARVLYFAQLDDGAGTRFWPARATWPQPVAALLPSDF